MTKPKLTEAIIQSLATPQSFSRGRSCYENGAVLGLERRGDALLAYVEGSDYEPYLVTVRLDVDGVVDADCACPYDWGGYCKHIVAVLLTFVYEAETITERPSVSELIADLDRETIGDLLVSLVESHPQLVDWLETRITVTKQVSEQTQVEAEIEPRHHRTFLDPVPFRRRAHAILTSLDYMRPSEAYWHTGGMVSQLRELIQQAQPFLEACDGRNGLVILEAVTKAYIDLWGGFDDSDGELGDLFAYIGSAFTEAILSADLSMEERTAWADKLTKWQGQIEVYGVDEGFDAAIAAAVQGWDYLPLQRAMEGHITRLGAWDGDPPWYAGDLALARLKVLERLGKTDEYLNLAEAEGQTLCCATMLVELDRGQEAVAYGLNYLSVADEALVLARSLRDHGLHPEALQIAEHGLSLHGDTYALACWLRDFAVIIGQTQLALQAAKAAFTSAPMLDGYQAVQTIAGPDWPELKSDLLRFLDTTHSARVKVDIYLHEGMVDEAVKAVTEDRYVGYATLERVVDAAYESHPDWAIRRCKAQAERIMDAGQSKYYHHAIDWLNRARLAYKASGRVDEWRTYLEGLIVKHKRKYSLRPRLEGLR